MTKHKVVIPFPSFVSAAVEFGLQTPNRSQATDCLKARDGLNAERPFRQALVPEPDEPDPWKNLAAALVMQHREAEALAIIREVHGRFPEYPVARTALGRHAMLPGKLLEFRNYR